MDHSDTLMKSYYRERAPIYDQVYSYPERQKDLRILEEYIPEQFKGRNVLEVAAGTGYWTQFISEKSESILATDATIEALVQIKNRPNCSNIPTKVVDAYSIHGINKSFNGVFAGLWLSHVPKQRLKDFLGKLNAVAASGAVVLFIDNTKTQCERLPITFTDGNGNTYQDRELESGAIHRVLKNFPTEDELIDVTKEVGVKIKYLELENFWLFQYQLV